MADSDDDLEFTAMRSVFNALNGLPDDAARARVLEYAASRLGLVPTSRPRKERDAPAADGDGTDTENDDEPSSISADTRPKFDTFAELFDATGAETNAQRALVAGYWLQVCQGADSFSGAAINNELKNLGEVIGNVTNALDSLKNQKPALALQLKKSGKSQQARKSYKITVPGVKAVEAMLNG